MAPMDYVLNFICLTGKHFLIKFPEFHCFEQQWLNSDLIVSSLIEV